MSISILLLSEWNGVSVRKGDDTLHFNITLMDDTPRTVVECYHLCFALENCIAFSYNWATLICTPKYYIYVVSSMFEDTTVYTLISKLFFITVFTNNCIRPWWCCFEFEHLLKDKENWCNEILNMADQWAAILVSVGWINMSISAVLV